MGGGANAIGITGVSDYSSSATVYDDVAKVNPPLYNQTVKVGADDREYQRGHILADALGGSGSADNIFRQDGGQNTTGDWPSHELTVGKRKVKGDPNADMVYNITLHGLNGTLKYNQYV
mgnify:CR=1 FL=1